MRRERARPRSGWRLGDLRGDQRVPAFGVIGAGRTDIQRPDQPPVRPPDRRVHAGKAGIPGIEMLVAMNGDLSPLGQTGADTIRALGLFGPVGATPQPPMPEGRRIQFVDALFQHDALGIGQQHIAAGRADQLEQLVQLRAGDGQEFVQPRAALGQFGAAQAAQLRRLRRVQPMLDHRAAPACGKPGDGGGRLRCPDDAILVAAVGQGCVSPSLRDGRIITMPGPSGKHSFQHPCRCENPRPLRAGGLVGGCGSRA